MTRKLKTLAESGVPAGDEKNLGISSPYEDLPSQTGNPTAVGGMNTEYSVQINSSIGLLEKWKSPTASNEPLRRSVRLKSLAMSQRVNPIAHHVDIDEIEKEEEPPQSEKVDSPAQVVKEKSSEVETQVEQGGPPNDMKERRLNEMVSYLVRAVDDFKLKLFERPYEEPTPDVRYKSLYFSSQKKVNALMEENYELVRKLEFAEGQIAAYQKMIDVMGAMKEVVFVSRMEKSSNGKVSLPPQATQNCVPSTSAAGAGDELKQQKRSHKKRKA